MFPYAQVLLTVFVLSANVQGAKILGVFNVASISHQVVFQPIWKELSLRGHDVTIMSPNPLKDSSLVNLTEIDLSYLYRSIEQLRSHMAQTLDHWSMLKIMPMFLESSIEDFFQHKEVMAFIKNNDTKFDVVLTEAMTPVLYAFATKFQCPLIGIASLSVQSLGHEAAGTPNHPVLYPDMLSAFTEDMTFLEKVEAVIFHFWQRYVYIYQLDPIMNRVVRKYFGESTPDLREIEKNMSMLFLNTNPILHGPRPYGPNVIEMGRMHLKPKRPLPNDIKHFLDNSKTGVIYFSLGSNVQSKYLDEGKRKLINNVFSELPYDVLWKFEDEELEGKPANVKISKWVPQQDLLGHPNVKLFITQAGLQSLEEAIANGVPLLAIPFMADQYSNAARIEKLGIGLQLRYPTLTKDDFKTSILKILQEPKYKEAVLKISELLQDEPTSGLERAVWWTEYVIRNKGAPYFRNRSVDWSWGQFLLLDVFVFLLTILLAVVYLFYKVVRFVIGVYGRFRFKHKKAKVL